MKSLHHTPYTLHSGYYPFGSGMSDRSFNGYRYGFNGQEKDDEIVGKGNSNTAEFWQYDGRLGRRWNVDPKLTKNRSFSQYLVFEANPIFYFDPKGDKIIVPFKEDRKEVLSYFGDLFGVDHGFKILRNGKLKIDKKWYEKQLNRHDLTEDHLMLLKGFNSVILDKRISGIVKLHDGNYDEIQEFEVNEYKLVPRSTDQGQLNSFELVTTHIEFQGIQNISSSKTIFFNRDPTNVYINLCRNDNGYPFNGVPINQVVNGASVLIPTTAYGDMTSSFVHETLDHFMTIVKDGEDQPVGGEKKWKVEFENKSRRIRNLTERTGEDHD